jgi:hypothetical protein
MLASLPKEELLNGVSIVKIAKLTTLLVKTVLADPVADNKFGMISNDAQAQTSLGWAAYVSVLMRSIA